MARPVSLTFALVAMSLVLAAAATWAVDSTRSIAAGADFAVVCVASTSLASDHNPYDRAVFETLWPERLIPLTYSPLLVRALGGICGLVPYWMLVFGAAALVIAISLRVPGMNSGVLTTTAVLTGFGAFPWLVVTANLATIEGVMGAVVAIGLVAGRPRLFGAALGVAGFVKIAPLLLLAAAWVRWPARPAWRATAAGIIVFGALQGLSYLTDPVATVSYWRAVTDGFGGHAVQELTRGGITNPSHFSFLPILAARLGAGREFGLVAAVLVTLAGAAAWWRVRALGQGEERARIWLAAGAMMLIAVGYPRFKPYTLFVLTPLLALALCRLPARARHAAIVMTCLAPCLALTIAALAPMFLQPPRAVVFVLAYSQWLLAAAALVVLLSPRGHRLLTGDGIRNPS